MKKFIVFLFAICQATSSFANICGGRSVISTKGELLTYDTSFHKLGAPVSCDTTKTGNWMVGCDGKIYECTDNKWAIVKSGIKSCSKGWADNAASDRNKPANTISNPTDDGYIYFFNPNQKSFKYSICQYTKTQCDKDYDDCKARGDFPTNCTICGPITGGAINTVTQSPNHLIITCENKGDINCTLSQDLKPTSCKELKKTTITSTDILYIAGDQFDECSKHISASINRSTCPAIQTAFVGDRQYLLFCITNPNIEIRYTNEPTEAWSYAHKQCVGSWGSWDETNQKCDCSALEGTEAIGYECQCTENPDQKYYNKLWTGCAKLKDGAYLAGTKIKAQGFGYDLKDIDKANSCSPSGGTWQGSTNNSCKCDQSTLHMKLDGSEYFCNCQSGYDYINPLYKTDGCMLIKDIPDHPYNLNGATESTPEQPTITTDPKKNCANTGGDGLDENGKCICNKEKDHLIEYKYKDEYSICRCMDGYHRNNQPDTNGKYKAEGECVEAYEIKQVPDAQQWQRDTESAYRNEYDNAQSWANKGTTALSTLMTGEGAKMAAQALAEQIADRDAETEMRDYIAGMRCEYGNGNTLNIGNEDITLPGGNELANYYAEYKTLADKLKATKAALNLRSGIEDEVLYNRAETGLYQYKIAEIQSGSTPSLSRALMDGESADATAWNAQKTATQNKLITGGVLATVGLAGSYIANRAINKDHVKKYKELEEKFREIKKELLNKYPEVFVPETKEETKEEVVKEEIISPAPIQAAQIDQNKSEILPPISGEAFDTGSITLNKTGEKAVKDAATDIANLFNQYDIKSITVTATGYTDPQTISAQTATNLTNEYQTLFGNLPASYNGKIDENSELSEVRAKVVLKSLTDNLKNSGIDTTPESVAIGGGIPTGCERGNIKKQDYKKCRKINITINYTYAEPIE